VSFYFFSGNDRSWRRFYVVVMYTSDFGGSSSLSAYVVPRTQKPKQTSSAASTRSLR